MYFYAKNTVWPLRQKLGAIPTTSGSLLFSKGESELGNVEERSTEAGQRWENTPRETHRLIYLNTTLVSAAILTFGFLLLLCVSRNVLYKWGWVS